MAIEDQIVQDLTPGMKLTIRGATSRYQTSYSSAQKALRKLWTHKFLVREKVDNHLQYEGVQERLV